MNCEDAHLLINALVDGEISEADHSAIEDHFSACSECQATSEAIRLADEELARAFEPGRNAVQNIADNVICSLEAEPEATSIESDVYTTRVIRRADWRSVALALVIGFVLALVIFPPRSPGTAPDSFERLARPDVPPPSVPETLTPTMPQATPQIATLVARTGNVDFDTGSTGWSAAPLANFQCPSASKVRTSEGACCELVTTDGAVIRMNGDTEVLLRSPREVELQRGQVFCRTTGSSEIEVFSCEASAAEQSPSNVTWSVAGSGAGFLTEVSSKGEGRVISVPGSSVDVKTPSGQHQLRPGEGARIVDGKVSPSRDIGDSLLSASWIHPLLTKKGHGDPELNERVDELLARIGHSKMSMLYEREIRSLGEYCVLPLIRYVQSPISQNDPGRRASAMAIVADLAPSVLLSELLPLLQDDSPEVRYQAARALFRLTGETQGLRPEDWRRPLIDGNPAIELWARWWDRNRSRFPAFQASVTD